MTERPNLDRETGGGREAAGVAPATRGGLPEPVHGFPETWSDPTQLAAGSPAARGDLPPAGEHGAAGDPPAPDGRSFAERYRDTPWGGAAATPTTAWPGSGTPGSAPTDPAGPAGDEQSRGARPEPVEIGAGPHAAGPLAVARRLVPNRLAGAGILLLATSLVAGLVLAFGGGGAPGHPAPTDALPRVTGTPDPAAGRAAIDAFLATVARADLAYEIRLRGITTLGAAEAEVRATGKVAGRNVDLRYVVERSSSASNEARVIVVGSRTWSQAGGSKAWRRLTSGPANLPDVAALGGLADPAQLVHVDSGYRRGHRTEHLRTVPGWISPMTARAVAAWPEAIVRESVLDIWVLPDGRPVEVVYRFDALLPATPAHGVMSGTATFIYGRFGDRVTVRPPK